MSDSVLETLSESLRKTVMDESIDDNQRFKALIEGLHWARKLSTVKIAEKLNINRATLWRKTRKFGVSTRDDTTASQLANINISSMTLMVMILKSLSYGS